MKATFELSDAKPHPIDGSFAIAPEERRRRIRAADVPWGKPTVSSIRYPSDLCVRKPATEVIVVARGHAPGDIPVPFFDAGVRVGRVAKTVRLTGPRVWLPDGAGVGESGPINVLEIRYEHAFGGSDFTDMNHPVEDARNPVGRGVARHPSALSMKEAPQMEDPKEPIGDIKSKPKPTGLGPIGRSWEPRRKYFGTYSSDWVKTRAPLPPPDFDDRANLSAPAELIAAGYLEGGEEGAITNLSPGGGVITFRLPVFRVVVTFRAKGMETVVVKPKIDTVVIDTLAVPPPMVRPKGQSAWVCPLSIELVARASVSAPRRWGAAEISVEEARK